MQDVTAGKRDNAAITRRNECRESGQTMLEFALMLPFLLLLGVGVVEIGRAIFVTIVVNNAAVAGVEYGSQNTTTASIPLCYPNCPTYQIDMVTAAMNDAANNNLAGGTLTATQYYGCFCDDTTTGTSCYVASGTNLDPNTCKTKCSSGKQPVECVQVNTTETFNPLFKWPGLPSQYSANGRALMRVRQ